MKKVSDILPIFLQELHNIYSQKEIRSITSLTIDHCLGLNRSEIIIYSDKMLSGDEVQDIEKVLVQLRKGAPVQYVLSEIIFYGIRLDINYGALIPRPETEELVDWVVKDNKGTYKDYLDIGCGSGCIIIALSKNLEGTFQGLDISRDALDIARKNRDYYNLDIDLESFDIMDSRLNSSWDVIISNPPYVLTSQKKHMHQNILDHEPHIALFVDDKDPLMYYNRIADQAKDSLVSMGSLYFEINDMFGDKIVNMLSLKGFVNIELKKDINDKERMVKAVWK